MTNTIHENAKLLWKPSEEFISDSNLRDYFRWLEDNYSYSFEDYGELWDWSVSANEEFWESILEYYNVVYSGKYNEVISGDNMPNISWFEGIELSYAEHVFRNYTDDNPAIIYKTEEGFLKELSWQELVEKVASLRMFMLEKGIKKGDSIVAYLPNTVEATISFLATNSIGAIWSSASPDFGVSDNNDKWNTDISCTWSKAQESEAEELAFERVEFSHPIWVLYSSGTTGVPKAITHSVGGVLLEHLKYLGLHNNVKSGERFFWFTTTGWMMWNYLHASLLHGATIVLYDGSPGYPDMNSLWKLIEDAKINHFGIGASFVLSSMKAETHPSRDFDLSSLISIGSTGSPLPPEAFGWIYREVKSNVWVASISGGTDVCSAFVGGNPQLPVYSGEIQCRALGCDMVVFDREADEVYEEVGEMVIRKPMPSMPIYFWNDNNFERYKKSYFGIFPNIWRHGDWTKVTSRESVIIYGRSDATLNRDGVRIGTSEIYRAINCIEEIADSMVLSLEKKGGEFLMPIFLVLKDGYRLNENIIRNIKTTIKQKYSPRHIPDVFIEVSDIPYTISGKKMETPIKKILMGENIENSIKRGSMKNPKLLEEYLLLKEQFSKS